MRRPLLILFAALSGWMTFTVLSHQHNIAVGLAILSVVAVLWLTEALHVSVTALLVPLLAVSTGILTLKEALASFANPIIYLFLGGFALAAALKAHKIDQWLAASVIRLAKGRTRLAVIYLFLATAFISMWISNTATTAMMLPVVLGLLAGIHTKNTANTMVFVLLGVAYSANIGGIGTLVGSPPNAIAASILQMDFTSWLQFGLPLVVVLLPLTIGLLWFMLKPDFGNGSLSPSQNQPPRPEDVDGNGPDSTPTTPFRMQWTPQAKWVLIVFAVVVCLWLMSSQVSALFGIDRDFDAFVAIAAVIVLIGSGLLDWKDFNRTTDWGVLLLFGGGITLSVILSKTAASAYLADQLVSWFENAPAWVFLTLAVALMVFLTELASNTASAALLVPIFYSLPQSQTGVAPELLAIGVAISASCAFMLPVATPPNALVFGTGLVKQQQMVHCGIFVNLMCILVLSLSLHFF